MAVKNKLEVDVLQGCVLLESPPPSANRLGSMHAPSPVLEQVASRPERDLLQPGEARIQDVDQLLQCPQPGGGLQIGRRDLGKLFLATVPGDGSVQRGVPPDRREVRVVNDHCLCSRQARPRKEKFGIADMVLAVAQLPAGDKRLGVGLSVCIVPEAAGPRRKPWT